MYGISVVEKDSFQTSLQRIDEKLPIWWVLFLFQSPKEAVKVVVEGHGTFYPKQYFQNIIPYSVVTNSDITL